jgi:hypothetical protein
MAKLEETIAVLKRHNEALLENAILIDQMNNMGN